MHTLARLVAILIWLCANDPEIGETRLNVFFKIWVYLFEAIWVIYGSTFIYSEEVSNCEETARLTPSHDEIESWTFEHVETLRISSIVLLVLGYLIWIWIIGSLLFACAVYRMYTNWTHMDRETSQKNLQREHQQMNSKEDVGA